MKQTKNKPHDNSNTRGSGEGNVWKNRERLAQPLYSSSNGALDLLNVKPEEMEEIDTKGREEEQVEDKKEEVPAKLKSQISKLNTKLGISPSGESVANVSYDEEGNRLSLPTKPLNSNPSYFKDVSHILGGKVISSSEDSSLTNKQNNLTSLRSKGNGEVSPNNPERILREAELILNEIEETKGTIGPTELANSTSFNSLLSEANDQATLIDTGGFFSQSSLSLFLGTDPSLYSNLQMTEQSAARMRSHLASVKHGTYASVPLICGGYSTCPIAGSCWFLQKKADGTPDPNNSTFPLYKPCPVEASILQIKVKQYCAENIKDLESISPSTIALATKLAELDIYEIRVNTIFSKGDKLGEGQDLMQESTVVDDNGNVVKTTMKEHAAFGLKERIQKMRSQLLKELISTPEAKHNAKTKTVEKDKETSTTKWLQDVASVLNKMKQEKASNPLGSNE